MKLQGLYYKPNKQSYFFRIKIWETLIYLVEQHGLMLQLYTTTILTEILIFLLRILFYVYE
jgi:hypothetical protein